MYRLFFLDTWSKLTESSEVKKSSGNTVQLAAQDQQGLNPGL